MTAIYFSQAFDVDPAILDEYGAFDISVASDLPLFIDPFLLFNSENPQYQALHESILTYLRFLKGKAATNLDAGLIDAWYSFREVKQNWLGFTVLGNSGHALGTEFAYALHESLGKILPNFGSEGVTQSSHLEKLCLIKPRVGRDSISDFTTNLIKHFLLSYTQTFAVEHLDPKYVDTFAVPKSVFNYNTESWATRKYKLPSLRNDFVLLTPADILTRDDTWINQSDMIRGFHRLPAAVEDDSVRGSINNYFKSRLRKDPTAKEIAAAAQATIREFPELIDYYIREKEDAGSQASSESAEKTRDTHAALVAQVQAAIPDIESKTDFYQAPWTSYEECLERVRLFKDYVENKDGYRLINWAGHPFSQEAEVQVFFGLIWCKTEFDVNREPNNGRGPVDFKVSFGAGDKSLIEFKLASNTRLRRNLEKQVEIYEAANNTRTSVKAIVCYTETHQKRAAKILKELGLDSEESVILIDARSDNKPSASKA